MVDGYTGGFEVDGVDDPDDPDDPDPVGPVDDTIGVVAEIKLNSILILNDTVEACVSCLEIPSSILSSCGNVNSFWQGPFPLQEASG